MRPHRIFVAINLPDTVKQELLEYKNKWPEIPARWAGKENLHLTLAFLGNTSDEELREVGEKLINTYRQESLLRISLEKPYEVKGIKVEKNEDKK